MAITNRISDIAKRNTSLMFIEQFLQNPDDLKALREELNKIRKETKGNEVSIDFSSGEEDED